MGNSRYEAFHVANSFTAPGSSVGDDLSAAMVEADRILGDGLQEGELQIIDLHTVGMVAVKIRKLPSGKWQDAV